MIYPNNYLDLKEYFKSSIDVCVKEFYRNNHYFICLYVENLGNISELDSYYMPYINSENLNKLDSFFPGIFNNIAQPNFKDIEDKIFTGRILLFIDNTYFYEIMLSRKPLRNPTNSKIDPINLLGSNDGFIEDAKTNIALIRKRLKTNDLVVEEITLGDTNKTLVYVTYLKEFDTYKDEIIAKLKKSKPKYPASISSINKIFQGNALMPLTLNTGSPENFVVALTQGRTGIILDNSPIGLIVPVTLSSFSNMKNDEDSPFFYSIVVRFLIILFLIISIFGLGFMISIINYHPDSLTISILSNLKLTERGTSFTVFLEITAILILFEFYRFAASRSSPTYIQNIVIILGGLFIGQNAINSGLIGPLILLITSMSYLSSFAFTNNPYLISAISNFRFIILLFSHLFGMIGFFLASFLVIAYLSSLKSFDIPYLFPFSPFSKQTVKEFFIPRSKR